jgi:hypothetical protein
MSNEEVLYEDKEIKIIYASDREVYFLTFGTSFVTIPENTLDELAKTSHHLLRGKLSTLEPSLEYFLEKAHLLYERIGLAISQVRISELEEELRDANSKIFHH